MEPLITAAVGELVKLGPAVVVIAGLLWDRKELKKEREALQAMVNALQEKRLTEGRETLAALHGSTESIEQLSRLVERGLK